MIQLVLGLIILLTVVWFFGTYKNATPVIRRRLVAGFFFAVLFGAVLFFTVTGRLHFLAPVVTALLPFAKRILPLLRYVPVLRRFVRQKNDNRDSGGNRDGAAMSKLQAFEVLGLKPGASNQEVIDAHRKLMQKVHPDRGGNDYLAAQLNQAKDTLLS